MKSEFCRREYCTEGVYVVVGYQTYLLCCTTRLRVELSRDEVQEYPLETKCAKLVTP